MLMGCFLALAFTNADAPARVILKLVAGYPPRMCDMGPESYRKPIVNCRTQPVWRGRAEDVSERGRRRMRSSMPGRSTLSARRGRIVEQIVSACAVPLLCRAVRGAAPSDVRRHLGRGTGSVCQVAGWNLVGRAGDAQESV